MIDRNKEWEEFNKKKTNYPKWPNELMLKVLFGNYLSNKIELKPNMDVLDIGCGFGNNLKPFLDLGFNCSGTEVTSEMAQQTQSILENQGFRTNIKKGFNTDLPFNDCSFDILLSVGVIHYESSEESLKNALKEYSRVLKKDGILFLLTVGENHDIAKRSVLISNHIYKIQNYDFRDGINMFFFDNKKYLEFYLKKYFNNIETGTVTEQLMNDTSEFLIAVGRKNNI